MNLDFILLIFICMLFTKNLLFAQEEKITKTHNLILFSRQLEKVIKVRRSFQLVYGNVPLQHGWFRKRVSKESHSCSGLLFIDSIKESKALSS